MHRASGSFSYGQSLCDSFDERISLTSYVSRVYPAVLCHDFAQFDQLIRFSVYGGRIDKTRRHTDTAALHRLRDDRLHLIELLRSRFFRRKSHNLRPHLSVPDQMSHICGKSHRIHIFKIRLKVPADFLHLIRRHYPSREHGVVFKCSGIIRDERLSALPVYLAGYTLFEVVSGACPEKESQIPV